MKNYLLFFALSLQIVVAYAQQIAVENCSNPTAGFYNFAGAVDGRNVYYAYRSFGVAVAPEIVRWNAGQSRWEIVQTVAGGVGNVSVVVATNTNASIPNPPETGWVGNGYSCNATETKVYVPIAQTTATSGNWSSPGTWTSGIVPRAYDNVTISSDVNVDVDATCYQLTIADFVNVQGDANKKLRVLADVVGGTDSELNVPVVEMVGTARQNYGVSTIANLVVNNAAGVNLTRSAGNTATSKLDLMSGSIFISDFNLSLGSIPNSSPDRYVVTNGTGALTLGLKVEPGITTTTFPVGLTGTSFGYTPLKIIYPGGTEAGDVSVRVKDSFTQAAPTTKNVALEWNIASTIAGTAGIEFYWNLSNEAGGFNRNSLAISRFNGTSWEVKASGQSAGGTGPYSAQVSGITQFSPWGIFDSQAALPVTLTSFTATAEQETVRLEWSTSAETNSDRFEVEHSADAKSWLTLTSVRAKGESSRLNAYTYTHTAPFGGDNFYRLKMIDKDGTYTYSRIRNLRFGGNTDLSAFVYPNPVSERLFIQASELRNTSLVTLVNASGVEVLKVDSPDEKGISIKHLPAGIYTARVKLVNGNSLSHRVLIDH